MTDGTKLSLFGPLIVLCVMLRSPFASRLEASINPVTFIHSLRSERAV